jgi:chemosensory pili system protein ChpA (sensor histidine kinase/response regulator)
MLRYRVLAVEDDLDAMKLLRMVLQHMPLEIDHVLTGAEAIAYLDRQLPDLLFLDISLPDMRGWEVLELIKADARLKEVRVIILTSHTEPVHRLIGSLQPIAAYLHKPISTDELRDTVTNILQLT